MHLTDTPQVDARAVPYGPELRKQVLGSFRGPIKPVPVSMTYQLGLALVAVAMVLLPLIYVALVALAGYGVFYHAVHHLTWLRTMRPAKVAFFVYIAPLVAGVVVVFFMLKPLFARPARGAEPRSLERDQEPVLFAFVEKLCATVGAPLPRRIDVDCEVNASASLRRGLLSLFSQDLVLTIGLPLAGGLSLQQLAGVLAHELGHFAQGAGMRVSYVIRRVNGWFARVVYERDAWDEKLAQASSGGDSWVVVIAAISRAAVWLTRRVLWALMWLGHGISSFMMRQMEFDADRYEARLTGAGSFEATSQEIVRLSVAFQQSMADLGRMWQEGRLSDDLPALVQVNRGRLNENVLLQLRRHAAETRTGIFDTHPADRDRVASARREGARGVFQSALPASALFRDFEALARGVTLEYYRELLDQDVDPERLQEVAHLAAKKEQDDLAMAAARRVFQGVGRMLPLQDAPPPAAASRDESREALEQMRGALRAGASEYRQQLERWSELRGTQRSCQQLMALRECGLSLRGSELGLEGSDTLAGLAAQTRSVERRLAQVDEALSAVETLVVQRSELALAALDLLATDQPELAQRQQDGKRWQRAAAALGAQSSRLRTLEDHMAMMVAMGSHLEGKRSEEVRARFLAVMDQLRSELVQLEADWAQVPYPFDHAEAGMTLAGYLLPNGASLQDPVSLYNGSQHVLESGQELYARLLAALADLLELAEAGLGLEPLPWADDEARTEAA